jgi:hypothetical protein
MPLSPSDLDAGRTLGREVSIQGMAAGCLLAMGGDRALPVRRGEAAKGGRSSAGPTYAGDPSLTAP